MSNTWREIERERKWGDKSVHLVAGISKNHRINMDLVGIFKPCLLLKGISQHQKINMDLAGIPKPCLRLKGISQNHTINMYLEVIESSSINRDFPK